MPAHTRQSHLLHCWPHVAGMCLAACSLHQIALKCVRSGSVNVTVYNRLTRSRGLLGAISIIKAVLSPTTVEWFLLVAPRRLTRCVQCTMSAAMTVGFFGVCCIDELIDELID